MKKFIVALVLATVTILGMTSCGECKEDCKKECKSECKAGDKEECKKACTEDCKKECCSKDKKECKKDSAACSHKTD